MTRSVVLRASRPRMPLTDKNGGYLIERYSIFVAYAYGGASRFKIWTVRDEENGHGGKTRFPGGDRHDDIAGG
jgi:hypothetical protein